MVIESGGFDFIDFGASIGGSIDFAQRVLGGKQPLGIDINPEKVAQMRNEGFDCMEADVTALDLPENLVRFVVMSHFLEHLPSLEQVRRALESAAKVAQDFLFIQGPFFDADYELAERGLKFYWSSWSGHTCHLTSVQIKATLDDLGLTDYMLMFSGEVTSSHDPSVHPVASPKNQQEYDPAIHQPKPNADFRPCLFREMVCVVRVGEMDGWHDLVRRISVKKRAVAIEACESDGSLSRLPEVRGSSASLRRRRILKLTEFLLVRRRWDFLDYLHLRDAVRRSGQFESAFFVTADTGFGAIALALEFPQIQFHLAAALDCQKLDRARETVSEWALDNVVFEKRGDDGATDTVGFDLVALCNVIHRFKNPGELVSFALSVARRWVYATTPRSSAESPSHHVVETGAGFSLGEFESLFPGGQIRGCYWRHRGSLFRERLSQLSDDEIRESTEELVVEASMDVIDAVPLSRIEALGMSVFASPSDRAESRCAEKTSQDR